MLNNEFELVAVCDSDPNALNNLELRDTISLYTNYEKMIGIVLDSGYRGWIGVEYEERRLENKAHRASEDQDAWSEYADQQSDACVRNACGKISTRLNGSVASRSVQ